MRCKTCGFSSTLELQDLERRLKEEQVENLSVLDKAALSWPNLSTSRAGPPTGPVRLERMSERAISRTTGVSRMTIAKLQKKVLSLSPKL